MSDPSQSHETNGPAEAGGAGLSEADRRRIDQLFQRGKKCLERADYDYAHDLFSQCVAEAPGELAYVQHFRANLAQMHPAGGSRGGGLAGLVSFGGARGGVAKAAARGAWSEAFAAGCQALKKSPGDTAVLAELAGACDQLGHKECALYYLRWSLDLAPSDPDINRQAAALLESMGQFDQAIGCWVRVQQQKPGDEQASKAIARLSVEKTIDDGQYNPALLSGAAEVERPRPLRVSEAAVDAHERDKPVEEKPDEQKLRAAIDATPDDPQAYASLADFYTGEGRLHDAEMLYGKALKVAGGGDLELLEKLEETYLSRMRERAVAAHRRAAKQASESVQKASEQALREANEAEAKVYAARSERSPGDPQLRFEYGLRLKRIGKHREAIEPLQAAREDTKRAAEAHLHLGECFQQIGQHQLAIRSYEASIAACPEGEWSDLRKLALYRAGVLSMGLGRLEDAENHLTELASADFGYRDVAERLDKIARRRQSN